MKTSAAIALAIGGLGAGDTLTVRFDQATNMVAASTKAEIDAAVASLP